MKRLKQQNGIYVESFMRTSLEELWQKTQEPTLHQQWDLRFSTIEYLPHPDPSQPQQFLYATRIGLGLSICGGGETVANVVDRQGNRISSLKFWSDDLKSLITRGSGYWRYIPQKDGIRFVTWYDYQCRFGWSGKVFDKILFRPLIGWATAWSFDCLRLWQEKGLLPVVLIRRALVHATLRLMLVSIWVWQSLMFLFSFSFVNPFVFDSQHIYALIYSQAQFVGGLAMLIFWRQRQLLWGNYLLLIPLVYGLTMNFTHPLESNGWQFFLSFSVSIFTFVGYFTGRDLPSAQNCLRHSGKETI